METTWFEEPWIVFQDVTLLHLLAQGKRRRLMLRIYGTCRDTVLGLKINMLERTVIVGNNHVSAREFDDFTVFLGRQCEDVIHTMRQHMIVTCTDRRLTIPLRTDYVRLLDTDEVNPFRVVTISEWRDQRRGRNQRSRTILLLS